MSFGSKEIIPVDLVGGPQTIIGSIGISQDENTNKTVDFEIDQPVHLQGVQAQWLSCKLDDYAQMGVSVAGSKVNPVSQSNSGDSTLEVPNGLLYDPNIVGGGFVDILDNNGVFLESIKILSVSGNILNLENPLSQDVLVTYTLYSVPTKYNFKDNGLRVLGDGSWQHFPEKALTQILPTGTIFTVRFFTSNVVATRNLVANFICRSPEN